jgi:hypothetical protein
MMQLRSLCLCGNMIKDACVSFVPGANVITGVSDTGKSYILRCIDYALGAESLSKQIEEAPRYARVVLELQNSASDFLTIMRHLGGGDVDIYRTSSDRMQETKPETVPWRRAGKTEKPDLSKVVMDFAGIPEARLRKNERGETQRLTLRVLTPLFLIDENAIISERSPLLGEGGYDETPHKRAFSFLLTGKDDSSVVAAEKREIVQAEQRGRLALIEELLEPIETRLAAAPDDPSDDQDRSEKVTETIERLTSALTEDREERSRLRQERISAIELLQKAESQLIAIAELRKRYDLLDQRYKSDLERLDFIAEGAYYLNGLQEIRCPLCDQPLTAEHRAHLAGSDGSQIYSAAQAEAAKIRGLLADLHQAVRLLEERRRGWGQERDRASEEMERIEKTLVQDLGPRLQETKQRLDSLIQLRLNLESRRADEDQVSALREFREQLTKNVAWRSRQPKQSWAGLDRSAVHGLCLEIQKLLQEWAWPGRAQVSFDEKAYDIELDGKPRQSHGKGVRAVLRSAFAIGAMRYASNEDLPHPGFVIIDSPLATFKQGKTMGDNSESIAPEFEAAFWASIARTSPDLQILVLENKEPPPSFTGNLNLVEFSGPSGSGRRGFMPAG